MQCLLSQSMHIGTCFRTLSSQYSTVACHTCLFPSVDSRVSPPFRFVANASMNTSLQMSARVSAFNYFGYESRGGISGSYGNAVFIFA